MNRLRKKKKKPETKGVGSFMVELLYEIKTENILESREKNLFMGINYRVKFLRLLIRVKRD